ncbi:serine/threonine-protein kinase [Streptomyces griseosporeus]|uniref:serine/threonine-protein kinase n=1 Tax=Streptomyces griseosporeus TaxID=1910 RepID=UPI0036FA12FA
MERLGPGDPQRIGTYRLLARLGAGGMGEVFLARSDRGRTVAVKLVREELAAQEEFRARFRQEVHAAQRVGGHWTAPVLDADTEAAVPWVATGYVAGPSLQQVVGHDHGALPERSVRILAAGLAHALQDIHAAGIVHRDLKPSNVLVTIDGPRVIDFGIARALETVTEAGGLTRTGSLVGSPGFMAPEQVRGDRITPACDVFCLGSVLAYAATGRLPFGSAHSGVHALMYRIAQEEPDLEGVPEGIADLVRDCLRKDPAARPTLDRVLDHTGADDTLTEGRSRDPWLPSALVAQLGRHAVRLLDTEDPEGAEPGAGAGAAVGAGGASPEHAAAADASPRYAALAAPAAPVASPPPAPHASPAPAGPQGAPPPPGRPGHVPTVIAGQGMPTPPPAAPAPPHRQHPQHQPAYGYPQPYATAAYPPGDYGPPPRRNGRTTALLVLIALVVALAAGGTVYALLNGGDDDPTPVPTTAPPTPTGTDAGPSPSPSPSPSTGSGSPQAGAVPEAYVGTWAATIDNASGENTRLLTIRQGEVGDPVLTLVADGPTDAGSYHCVFEASLAQQPSADGPLEIGPSTVTTGTPRSSCSPGAPTRITLLPDGTLERVNTSTDEKLTYTRQG